MQKDYSDANIAERLRQSLGGVTDDHDDNEVLALRRFLVPINPDPLTPISNAVKKAQRETAKRNKDNGT